MKPLYKSNGGRRGAASTPDGAPPARRGWIKVADAVPGQAPRYRTSDCVTVMAEGRIPVAAYWCPDLAKFVDGFMIPLEFEPTHWKAGK